MARAFSVLVSSMRHAPRGLGHLPVSRRTPLGGHVRLGPVLPRQFREFSDVAVAVDPQQVHVGAVSGDFLDLLFVLTVADDGHDRVVRVDRMDFSRDVVEPLPEPGTVGSPRRNPIQLVAHRPAHHRRMVLHLANGLEHALLLLGDHLLVVPVHPVALAPDRQIDHRHQAGLLHLVEARPVRPGADRIPAGLAEKIVRLPSHRPLDVERLAIPQQPPVSVLLDNSPGCGPLPVCKTGLRKTQSDNDRQNDAISHVSPLICSSGSNRIVPEPSMLPAGPSVHSSSE